METKTFFYYGFSLLAATAILFSRCQKEDEKNTLVVTTTDVTEITRTAATTGGNITDDGGAEVTARGVCWCTDQNPTINDSKTEDGSGVGSFYSRIAGLEPNTTYYVRAYAKNKSGTVYGEQQVFTTLPPLSWAITNFTEDDGLISNRINSLAVDDSNNIWAATSAGLAKFDGSSWTSYTTADGLIDDAIRVLSFNPDGNLWIGSWESGVSRFDGQTWTNYTEEDGLYSNHIYSIHADQNGNILIGSRNNHLTIFDGSTFDSFAVNPKPNPDGTIMGHIHAIHDDHDGNLWVGSCYTGLSMFDGENWTHDINNLSSFINTIFCTSDGDIWLGQSPLGAFQYSNDSWKNYPERETMIRFVYTVGEDANGNIWVGGRDGISVFKEDAWEFISSEDGLINTVAGSIVGDNDGAIWVGGVNGLSKITPLENTKSQ